MEEQTEEKIEPNGGQVKETWKQRLGVDKVFQQEWIVKNMYFFLFLAFLTVVYIYNGHYAEKTVKKVNKTARQLKELQYEYKTVKGELMMLGKQSELAKAVEQTGLKELKEPPVRIEISN